MRGEHRRRGNKEGSKAKDSVVCRGGRAGGQDAT